MVEQRTILTIKQTTKQKFMQILKQLKDMYPDYKVNQDYVLRKLIEKYEGVNNE